jgi:hypothetical protein
LVPGQSEATGQVEAARTAQADAPKTAWGGETGWGSEEDDVPGPNSLVDVRSEATGQVEAARTAQAEAPETAWGGGTGWGSEEDSNQKRDPGDTASPGWAEPAAPTRQIADEPAREESQQSAWGAGTGWGGPEGSNRWAGPLEPEGGVEETRVGKRKQREEVPREESEGEARKSKAATREVPRSDVPLVNVREGSPNGERAWQAPQAATWRAEAGVSAGEASLDAWAEGKRATGWEIAEEVAQKTEAVPESLGNGRETLERTVEEWVKKSAESVARSHSPEKRAEWKSEDREEGKGEGSPQAAALGNSRRPAACDRDRERRPGQMEEADSPLVRQMREIRGRASAILRRWVIVLLSVKSVPKTNFSKKARKI